MAEKPVTEVVVTPHLKSRLRIALEDSERREHEFGGFLVGTYADGVLTLEDFYEQRKEGTKKQVKLKAQFKPQDIVANWHIHPTYASPEPSEQDIQVFTSAAEDFGHFSVLVIENTLYVFYGPELVWDGEWTTAVSEDVVVESALAGWFGKSKVVDNEGKPLVVYHGTHEEFEEFSKEYISSPETEGGFFFTDVLEQAQDYGEHVIGAYLRILKPYVVAYKQWQETSEPDIETLKEKGYDGIVITDFDSATGDTVFEDRGNAYVVFEPSQIKRTVGESIAEALEPELQPTEEMKDWFKQRTNRHIELVQKYAQKIADADPRFVDLPLQASIHDASKFEEPEYTPYCFVAWDYKCKKDGVPFELSDEMKEEMNVGTLHHIKNNSHHVEFHTDQPDEGIFNRDDRDEPPEELVDGTKMSDLDISEMVSDWAGMAEELGTSPFDWAKKNVGVRWKFTPEQEALIQDLLHKAWDSEDVPVTEAVEVPLLLGVWQDDPELTDVEQEAFWPLSNVYVLDDQVRPVNAHEVERLRDMPREAALGHTLREKPDDPRWVKLTTTTPTTERSILLVTDGKHRCLAAKANHEKYVLAAKKPGMDFFGGILKHEVQGENHEPEVPVVPAEEPVEEAMKGMSKEEIVIAMQKHFLDSDPLLDDPSNPDLVLHDSDGKTTYCRPMLVHKSQFRVVVQQFNEATDADETIAETHTCLQTPEGIRDACEAISKALDIVDEFVDTPPSAEPGIVPGDVFESIIDPTQDTLDPDLFVKEKDGYSPKPELIDFVTRAAEPLRQKYGPFEEFFLKGSILTFEWTPEGDIDVYIVNTKLTDEQKDEGQDLADTIKPKFAQTKHPIEFYIDNKPYPKENADAMYDLLQKTWVKPPVSVHADVEDYLEEFSNVVSELDLDTAELIRDLIDYEMLKKVGPKFKGEVEKKIQEIDDSVQDLVDQFEDLKDTRHEAFQRDLTLEQIREYGSKNLLPENVLFKLLQRFAYLELLKALKEITDGGEDPVDTPGDVEQVQKVIGKLPMIKKAVGAVGQE